MGGSDNKGDGLASQPRRYRVPGQPLLNRHQVEGVSRSPDGLFAQQEWEPIRGRPTVRGKKTYGGRPGRRVEEQGTWAAQKHSEAGDGRPVDRGVWTAKTVKRPRQQPAHPQYANYWAPLTRKRHTMPHSAQSQHANYWAPRTRKRHQQSTGRSGRQKVATRRNMRRAERVTVQGPVKEQQPDGMSHRGGGGGLVKAVFMGVWLGQIHLWAFLAKQDPPVGGGGGVRSCFCGLHGSAKGLRRDFTRMVDCGSLENNVRWGVRGLPTVSNCGVLRTPD